MLTAVASAAYRATLFCRLDAPDSGQAELDRISCLLRDGRQVAQRAQLGELATQFAEGQSALLEALRSTGHFLGWELEIIRLALVAGDVRAGYRYLSAHYTRLTAFGRQIRRNLLLPAAVFVAVSEGLPLLGFVDGLMSAVTALVLALVPLLMVMSGGCVLAVSARRWQVGVLGRSWIDRCYRLPLVGSLLARQQSLHYFNNLSLCTGAGLPLGQSLQMAATALPYSPRRIAFGDLYYAVAAGGRLSDALRQSGALSSVRMCGAQDPAGETGAMLAQKVLTESTRQSVVEGMVQCARWLPQVLLLLLPLVLLANLWVMGFG